MTLADFHFLRPEWLLALIPAAALTAMVARKMARTGRDEWAGLVDAHLLRHLAVRGKAAERSVWLSWVFGIAMAASVLAMAGPTWQKVSVPAYRSATPTVIVLSMAQSMNGTDVSPTRLTRAGHKLRDILDRAKGDDVALIIYSDRPFVAAPLTSDGDVIQQMLPELSTSLMPVLGNRLDLALSEAENLLSRSSANDGRIIVLADDAGQNPGASRNEATAARRSGYSVNVIGIGTEDGARLQTAQGQAITTREGADVTMRLDVDGLTKVANAGGGVFTRLAADDRDIQAVLPAHHGDKAATGEASDLKADTWNDMGHLLLFLPVLLAPLAFRRGLLFALALGLCGAGFAPSGAQAGVWADLWQTPDQQGQRAFDQGDYAAAAEQFRAPDWKAGALYRSGDYAAAAGLFTQDAYNRGNALAQDGQFQEALAAYDDRLKINPQDADAQFNRDLVQKLLQQQQQQQQKQDQQSQDSKGQQGDKGQQSPSDPSQSDQADKGPQGQSGQQGDQAQQGQTGDRSQDQPAGQAGNDTANKPASGNPQDQSTPTPQQAQTEKENGADPQTAPGSPEQTAPGTTDTAKDDSFATAMDQQLDSKGDTPQPAATPAQDQPGGSAPALDQVSEQQLRSVPDDPSGLLRARIRQHYNRVRANQ